ncbi:MULTISPECIES: acyl-CoA carboxylase epsilon subunit [unclassified Streptomyces]|uniref:acyl-CoA carboxylase epsilon subunit n=1 Tax=unclassified Streptomyces TaxID=2593676 RepID=UPI00307806BB
MRPCHHPPQTTRAPRATTPRPAAPEAPQETQGPQAPQAPQAPPQPLLRIEKGNPDEAELAALTAVLLARAGVLPGQDEEAKQADRRTACWRRLERRTRPGTPRSWRDTAPRR